VTSSYVNLGSGAESAADVAMKIQAAGQDFVATAQSIVDNIVAAEASKPWGRDDETARNFLANYHVVPAGAESPVNEALQTSVKQSGDALSKLGRTVVEAMLKYGVVEAENATDINSAGGQSV
jgi:hypothetical protein